MIDHLKIGPVNYTVKEQDDLHTTGKRGIKKWLAGHVIYADGVIKVANDQAPDMKVALVWHEALHALLYHAGHSEQNEQHIMALGYGLVQLIRDNPHLVKMTLGEEI